MAFTRQDKIPAGGLQNLGAEELGGVYESLLALSPQISADGARFTGRCRQRAQDVRFLLYAGFAGAVPAGFRSRSGG